MKKKYNSNLAGALPVCPKSLESITLRHLLLRGVEKKYQNCQKKLGAVKITAKT